MEETNYQRWRNLKKRQMMSINPRSRENYNKSLYPYLVKKGKGRVSWNILFLVIFTFILFPLIVLKLGSMLLRHDKPVAVPVYISPVTPLAFQMQPTADFVTTTLLPMPTVTVTPTQTMIPTSEVVYESPTPVLYAFKLSFYDSAIGSYFPDKASVNCLDWDVISKKCNSKLLGGIDDYSHWYRRGLACPPQFPLYTKIEVVIPSQLAGVWTCVDRGGLIVDNWLDFLLRYPDQVWTGYDLDNFPWGSTVGAYITYPP